MVMGGLSGIETALILLVGLSGLAIGLVVLFSSLDWWIEYCADSMVQRSERRRKKALTKPSLEG
jgi:hypothetical protein